MTLNNATLNLNSGNLAFSTLTVGYVGGSGQINQSGGSAALGGLFIGSSGAGGYTLSGSSSLTVDNNETLGGTSSLGKWNGSFTQSGGMHAVGLISRRQV